MLDRDAIADFFVWVFYRVDWNAWAAIGTVGALWFAVVAATSNARSERLTKAGLLSQIGGLLEGVLDMHRLFPPPLEDMSTERHADFEKGMRDALVKAQQGMAMYSAREIATLGLAESLPLIEWALEEIQENIAWIRRAADRERRANYVLAIDVLRGAYAGVYRREFALRYGPIGSRLRGWLEPRRHGH